MIYVHSKHTVIHIEFHMIVISTNGSLVAENKYGFIVDKLFGCFRHNFISVQLWTAIIYQKLVYVVQFKTYLVIEKYY